MTKAEYENEREVSAVIEEELSKAKKDGSENQECPCDVRHSFCGCDVCDICDINLNYCVPCGTFCNDCQYLEETQND